MDYSIRILDQPDDKYKGTYKSLGQAFDIINNYCRNNNKVYYMNNISKYNYNIMRVIINNIDLTIDCCFEIRENYL